MMRRVGLLKITNFFFFLATANCHAVEFEIFCTILTPSSSKFQIRKLFIWGFFASYELGHAARIEYISNVAFRTPIPPKVSNVSSLSKHSSCKIGSGPSPRGITCFFLLELTTLSSFHPHAGIQQISSLPNLQIFILPYHDFIFLCLSIHSDMTPSVYINRSHAPLFSLEINLYESMPPEKLLTHSHFLQGLCYCCPPTSTPTKPAVAVLFSLHLYHTSYKELASTLSY